MKKNLAIFYQNLKNRNNDIPYLSTIMFFVFSFTLHLFQTAIIFDIPKNIFTPFQFDSDSTTRWVNSIIFVSPILVASLLIFKKTTLEEYELTELELRNGYKKHVIYTILTITLLMVLLISRG